MLCVLVKISSERGSSSKYHNMFFWGNKKNDPFIFPLTSYIKIYRAYYHFIFLLTDVPVWSKLETGRIPSPQEMFQIIENHMRFGQESS